MNNFKSALNKLLILNKPFVTYRLPNQTEFNLLSGDNIYVEQISTSDINNRMEGFLFVPFNKNEKAYFYNSEISKIAINKYHFNQSIKPIQIEKDNYTNLINRALSDISLGKMQKVVLSRTIHTNKFKNKFIPELIEALADKYPTAFVYLIQLPNGEKWIGASPETLLSIEKNHAFTMALAGTQLSQGLSVEQINWEDKEIQEQIFVAEYIESKLKLAGVRNCTKSSAYTRIAGHLAHICTDFHFEIESDLAQLIQQIHPTPAVCGTPLNMATNFILNHEGYNREYYTGFLGPIAKTNLNLFVNLRCMKIDNSDTYIYIGGGITKDSIPENEWSETANKANILISVINSIN
jgi:isochorismate synthase